MHNANSIDEAIEAGAKELGIDEEHLRREINSLEFTEID